MGRLSLMPWKLMAWRAKHSVFPRKKYDVVVCSAGGGGTTMLLDFLQPRTRVNYRDSNIDGIKHVNSPNHPLFSELEIGRAVYVFADPQMALLSLFRRDFHKHMVAKLRSSAHRSGREYREFISRNWYTKSFEDYLNDSDEAFGFEEHWRAWREEPVEFPVALVKYESMYDNLDALLDFLQLPKAAKKFPPKRSRKSAKTELTPVQQEKLDAKLSGLRTLVADAPGFEVRRPDD